MFDHPVDDSARIGGTGVVKALGDPVERPRSRNYELGLIEIHQDGVIQVDAVLEREEWSEPRILEEHLVGGFEGIGIGQFLGKVFVHHPV